MHAFVLNDGRIDETSDLQELRAALKQRKKAWIDLDRHSEEIDRMLTDDLRLHPLVIEDVWSERSSPKIDAYEHFVYIVAHVVTARSRPEDVQLAVLDIVVGDTFVVTQHRTPASRDMVKTGLRERVAALLDRGTPWLAHGILDVVVDRFLPLIDDIGADVERMEEDVFRKAGTPDGAGIGERIFALRRSIQRMARITNHQRSTLEKLAAGDFPSIPRDAVPYFRDVAEHFTRVSEQTDTLGDSVQNAMEAYLSMQSNRMNQTMKALTTMSTSMLPLTFIASVYGMNFKWMPELQWKYGYPFALALMALVGTVVYFVFRRKRWI